MQVNGHISRNYQTRNTGKWHAKPCQETKKARRLEKQIRKQQAKNNMLKQKKVEQLPSNDPAINLLQLNIAFLLLR